jgi:hypothetical protein
MIYMETKKPKIENDKKNETIKTKKEEEGEN